MVEDIKANLGSDASRRHAAETKETKVLTGQKQITLGLPSHARRRRLGSLCVDNAIVQWYLDIDEADIPRIASPITGQKDHLKTQDGRTLE